MIFKNVYQRGKQMDSLEFENKHDENINPLVKSLAYLTISAIFIISLIVFLLSLLAALNGKFQDILLPLLFSIFMLTACLKFFKNINDKSDDSIKKFNFDVKNQQLTLTFSKDGTTNIPFHEIYDFIASKNPFDSYTTQLKKNEGTIISIKKFRTINKAISFKEEIQLFLQSVIIKSSITDQSTPEIPSSFEICNITNEKIFLLWKNKSKSSNGLLDTIFLLLLLANFFGLILFASSTEMFILINRVLLGVNLLYIFYKIISFNLLKFFSLEINDKEIIYKHLTFNKLPLKKQSMKLEDYLTNSFHFFNTTISSNDKNIWMINNQSKENQEILFNSFTKEYLETHTIKYLIKASIKSMRLNFMGYSTSEFFKIDNFIRFHINLKKNSISF
jgi:hypothetical protein